MFMAIIRCGFIGAHEQEERRKGEWQIVITFWRHGQVYALGL
jgi:hypothetical protein